MEGDRLLTIEAVATITSMGKSTLYRMIAAGDFPQPVHIGPRATRWRLSEVQTWIDRLG